MQKTVCDRCGGDVREKQSPYEAYVVAAQTAYSAVVYCADLCAVCQKAFQSFMANGGCERG